MSSVSVDKIALVRRLLKKRVTDDPNAHALGQTSAIINELSEFQLMGSPEATIATCVESWAAMANQGQAEHEIAESIALLRSVPYSDGGVRAVINSCVRQEHASASFLPESHIDWCIAEARAAYGV